MFWVFIIQDRYEATRSERAAYPAENWRHDQECALVGRVVPWLVSSFYAWQPVASMSFVFSLGHDPALAPVFVWPVIASSTPGSSNTQTHCPACSSLRNSGSTRVPFMIIYWVLYWNSQNPRGRSKRAKIFLTVFTIFSSAELPPLDFSFSAARCISAPRTISACSTHPTL